MINDIYLKEKKIFRVLFADKNEMLVIDCVRRSMPKWVENDFLKDFELINQDRLLKELNTVFLDEKDMSKSQIKEMRHRYNSISGPLVKIANEDKNEAIYQAAFDYKASTQTIRKRLCDYLAFSDIRILMPKAYAKRELTEDQKNFRWALNKYFYQSKKLTLRQTYKKMIKEKYLDSNGMIVDNCPKIHQFTYFYRTHKSESNFIISI